MNTAINCEQLLLLSNKKESFVRLNFEVMCYMTHKCNDDKISIDILQDSERNIEIDPHKLITSYKMCNNVNSNAVCDATGLTDTTVSEQSCLPQL